MEFTQTFEIIVIGGGPAGYHFANLCGKKGVSIALFEERALGGTCLNEGCIPTKSFLKSAKIVDSIKHSEEFGVAVDGYSVNQELVTQRKNAVVNKLVMGVRGGLRKNKVKLFFTRATILEKCGDFFAVESDGKFFGAKKLVIATGSKALVPPIKGVDKGLESGFLVTSKEILDLTEIPENIVIIGAGVIGIEMASYFCSVGAKVIVVEGSNKICGNSDFECSKILKDNLSARGVEFLIDTFVNEIKEGSVIVNSEEQQEIRCDKVLLSVGRVANLDNLGLDNLGIEYTNKGIKVDDKMQTSVDGVYAIGDVNGKVMLAHTAYKEAEVCFNNLNGEFDHIDYDAIPSVVYSSPEFAFVGASEESLASVSEKITIKKLPMIYSGRFVTENSNSSGICKIIIDNDSNCILGAMMVGDGASEVILALSNLIALKIPVSKINKLIFPHPTIGEIIKDTLNA